MSTLALLHALGSCSLFASRVFLPALLTAVLLRFGPAIPWIGDLGVLNSLSGHPVWFTSDLCLLALLALSVAELAGDRVAELRELLTTAELYAKPTLAAATALGVVHASDAAFAGSALHQAGFGELALPAVAAAGTATLTWLRQGALGWLQDADPHDHLHVQRLLRWGEDMWLVVGAVVLVLLPALMVLGLLGAFALLGGLRALARKREAAARLPCRNCTRPMWRCAPTCAHCATDAARVETVGVLGQSTGKYVVDPESHALDLLGRLRCPNCAERLRRGDPQQDCSACGRAAFAQPTDGAAYVAHLDRKLPATLLAVGALSLVPVLGYIVGHLVAQLRLLGPARAHVPLGRRLLTRWLLRLVHWLVLVAQVLPGAGAVLAVVFTAVQYGIWRRQVLAAAAQRGGRTVGG